jgi:sec-independent protein translocase protein TatA
MILASFMNPEVWILGIILLLVLFGGKKIPELMRGVGQGVGELKKGMEDGKKHFNDAINHEPEVPTVKPPEESQPRTTPTAEAEVPAAKSTEEGQPH